MPDLPIQRFSRRPETVEAVQVTAENLAEVAAWCGGVVHEPENPKFRPPIPAQAYVQLPHWVRCHLGDWVLRREDGSFDGGAHQTFPDLDEWLPAGAQPTEYRLSPVPVSATLPDGHLWDVKVRLFDDGEGDDRWVVESMFEFCAGDGTWAHDPPRFAPNRQAWKATYIFPLDEALALAERAQWTLTVNGLTARAVLARHPGEA